jgi:hypothetical protein
MPDIPNPELRIVLPTQQITVECAPRTLRVNYVTDSEIDALASAGVSSSVMFGFFGISFGTLVSVSCVIATVDFASRPTSASIFWGLVWASGLLSLFLVIGSIRSYKQAESLKASMKVGLVTPSSQQATRGLASK